MNGIWIITENGMYYSNAIWVEKEVIPEKTDNGRNVFKIQLEDEDYKYYLMINVFGEKYFLKSGSKSEVEDIRQIIRKHILLGYTTITLE